MTITHGGPKPLLLLEGTMLDGGWQHRTLTRDVLIPVGVSTDVEVVCVEHGRWHGTTAQRASGRQVPLAVRGALRGIRAEQHPGAQRSSGADQGDVWARVARYERLHGASATTSLVDVQDRTAGRVNALIAGLSPLYGQRGVLIGVAGHPVLLEVFDHPRSLAGQWEPILRAVALDALAAPAVPTPGYRARAFVQRMQRVQRMRLHDEHAVAEAAEWVGRDDLVDVRALALAGLDLHVAALNVRHHLVLAA